MVHYDETYISARPSISRVFKRLCGVACLIAIPGIWIAVNGALPEARIIGLSLSIVLIGIAGLCLIGRK